MDNKRFKKMQKMKKKIIIITTLFGLIITAISFLCPLIIKYIIEDINDNTFTNSDIRNYILIIVGVYVLAFVFSNLSNLVRNRLSVSFKTMQSHKMYEWLMNMNYSAINEKQPTYLADRIFNSIETIYTYYSSVAKDYIINGVVIAACLALAYYFSLWLGIVLSVMIPIYLASYILLNKKLQNKCVNLQAKNSKSFASVISIINEVDFFKQLDTHENALSLIDESINNVNKENAAVTNFGQAIETIISTILGLSNAMMYIIISVDFVTGVITLSNYVFISMVLGLFFPAISGIVRANLSVRDIKAANDFIQNELLKNQEQSGTEKLDRVNTIEFKIPEFSYDKEPLLKKVDFSIKQSDKVFISGTSGSGKTSLVKGMLKFIEMDEIKVNGKNIIDYENQSYHSRFAFLSQNLPIIPDTLRNNILFGKKKDLGFLKSKKFMQKFFDAENGIDAVIYDNGANLSGGDKQKIALARLYLRDVDVIVLDESLNAIDAESKKDILDTLFTDFKDKTIIMISHETQLKEYFDIHYQIKDKEVVKV